MNSKTEIHVGEWVRIRDEGPYFKILDFTEDGMVKVCNTWYTEFEFNKIYRNITEDERKIVQ